MDSADGCEWVICVWGISVAMVGKCNEINDSGLNCMSP